MNEINEYLGFRTAFIVIFFAIPIFFLLIKYHFDTEDTNNRIKELEKKNEK